jgi:hypothetical protein
VKGERKGNRAIGVNSGVRIVTLEDHAGDHVAAADPGHGAGVSVLWVPTIGWYDVWDDYDDGSLPSGRWSTGRLSTDWWGFVELERRLLEPYVLRAAEFQVEVRRAGFERDLSRRGESLEDHFPGPLVVHERRWWSSLLAPVYLQLL